MDLPNLEIKQMIKSDFNSPITDIAFSYDQRLLILGYSDGAINIIVDADYKKSLLLNN